MTSPEGGELVYGKGRPAVPSRAAVEDDPVPNLYAIEAGLRQLEGETGQNALAVKNARTKHVEAKRTLRKARAAASLAAKQERRAEDGKPLTVDERKQFIEDRTDEEQWLCDLADVEVRYSVDLASERSDVRSSLQTRAKLALEVMRLAGYGRGA